MKQLSKITKRFSFLNFARVIISFSIITAAFQLPGANVYGQSPNLPGIDPTFPTRLSAGANIEKTILQPDGKMIIIGVFNDANGFERRNVVRLNADNSLDTSFNVPVSVLPKSMELLPDGKFIAFGFPSLVRLNSDGSLDPSFNFARNIQGSVPTFKARSDGKVIAYGDFQVKKGSLVIAEDFIVVDHLGGIESAFRPDIEGQIQDVSLLPNGKTIITGSFRWRHLGQLIGRNVAVLNEDGSPDLSFSGFYGKQGESVNGVALQPDGKLLIYGRFSEVYKSPLAGKSIKNKGLLRLNADGTFDRDFSVPFLPDTSLFSAFVQPDGKIVLQGNIYLGDGSSYHFISRVFSDGGFDQSYVNNLPFAPNGFPTLYKMQMQADGRVLMSGNLRVVNRPDLQKLIRLNTDGTLDAAFQTPLIVGSIFKFDNLPGGNILIYGTFGKIGAHTRLGVARLNLDGALDESFRFDFLYNESVTVSTLTPQPDGKFLIAGQFSTVNGEYLSNSEQARNSSDTTYTAVARLNQDGSLDTSFAPYTNTFYQIKRIAVQTDGKIIIGGEINPSFYPNFIIRLNPDGTTDTSFNRLPITNGGNFSTSISDIVLQPDGKILIAGYFARLGITVRNKIARLNPDGLPDETFDYPGYYTDFDVIEKIVLQPDGKIIGGGEFMNAYNSPGLPRFNRNGTLDANFRWNQIRVPTQTRDMQLQPDGRILFSGQIGGQGFEVYHPDGLAWLSPNGEVEFQFNVRARKFLRQADGKIVLFNSGEQAGGYWLTRIFADGSADNTFSFRLDRQANALVEQADGKILVAGNFMTVNGVRRNGLVRLTP